MFTIDAHLDLNMNAMEWNRDLRKSVLEIKESEKELSDKSSITWVCVQMNPLMQNPNLYICNKIFKNIVCVDINHCLWVLLF